MTERPGDRPAGPKSSLDGDNEQQKLDKPTGRQLGWERLDTRYPHVSPRFRVRQDRVRLPSGNEIEYDYTESKGGLWIVPVTHDGKIILIRQYRYPTDSWRWEVPAGGLHDHTGPLEELARRELAQEIGATCEELTHVTWYYGAANVSDAVCHVMLAWKTRLIQSPQREETEFIEIHPLPVEEALSRARSGELRDGRSTLALLLCEPHLKERGLVASPGLLVRSSRSHAEPISHRRKRPRRFSHPSEKAFAEVLDFYRIRWEYEPTTFPLEWDEDGRIITAFTPDFYLVEDDMYIELTTMKQRHVTVKNRKLRLLRQLYPSVKCKLMYRRDVENLGVKYGLFEDGPLPKISPQVEAKKNDEAKAKQ